MLVSKTVAEVGRTVGHRKPTAHSAYLGIAQSPLRHLATSTRTQQCAASALLCYRYCFSPTVQQTAVATETAAPVQCTVSVEAVKTG